jgi:multiple sugar transport system substrate-binding protein
MRRRHAWVALIGSLAVLAAACTAGGQSTKPVATVNPSASHAPVTITLWTFFSNPEFKEFETAITAFQQAYPWITVKTVPSKDNTAILQAINSGTAPDVAMEGIPDDSAKYCSTNAWIDLKPYIQADHIDVSKIVPAGALAYSSYQGVQCALPMLTDAYGLYYNTDMFQKAGISSPPKTYSELFADAKKLTTFNPDGSIKVAGFLPTATGDYELANFVNGIYSGAHWYDASGKSTLASDPKFAQMLTSLKQMTDWFGYAKLTRFFAKAGGEDGEFSPSNAFENGKLAMVIDGEWRVGFIKNDNSSVPYATAPFPVADQSPELYGVGQIGGTLVGIPRGTTHTAEAWLLVKYLSLNAKTQQGLAEQLHNVPTVNAALQDPLLTQDPHFATFLQIFANPNSRYKEITTLGLADVTLYDQFVDRYLAGKVTNLQAGLQQLATQIDKQLQLGG